MSPIAAYTILVLNATFLIAVGYFARKKQVKNSEDYLTAGRRVKWPMISGSIVITWAYGGTLLAAAEGVCYYGWPGVWIYSLSGVSLALAAPFFVRVKKALPHGTTFTEYVRLRFGDGTHKLFVICGLLINILLLMSLGAGLGSGIAPVFGLQHWQAVLFAGIIVIIFVLFGGLWSSIIADQIQYMIMWATASIIAIFAMKTCGGFDGLYNTLVQIGEPQNYALFTSVSFYDYALVLMIGYLVYACADQCMWMRAYALESTKDTLKALLFGWASWTTLPMVAGILGLVALSLGIVPTNTGSDFLANLISVIAPKWVMILWAFLIFNAIASTFGSVLVSLASIVTTDIIGQLRKNKPALSTKQELNLNSLLVVLFGILGIALSITPKSILWIDIFMGGFLIVTGVPIYLSLFMKNMNKKVIMIGSFAGFLIILFLGSAMNFGFDLRIGGYSVTLWQLYLFTMLLEAAIVLIGCRLAPPTVVSFEGLYELQKREYEAKDAVQKAAEGC